MNNIDPVIKTLILLHKIDIYRACLVKASANKYFWVQKHRNEVAKEYENKVKDLDTLKAKPQDSSLVTTLASILTKNKQSS